MSCGWGCAEKSDVNFKCIVARSVFHSVTLHSNARIWAQHMQLGNLILSDTNRVHQGSDSQASSAQLEPADSVAAKTRHRKWLNSMRFDMKELNTLRTRFKSSTSELLIVALNGCSIDYSRPLNPMREGPTNAPAVAE